METREAAGTNSLMNMKIGSLIHILLMMMKRIEEVLLESSLRDGLDHGLDSPGRNEIPFPLMMICLMKSVFQKEEEDHVVSCGPGKENNLLLIRALSKEDRVFHKDRCKDAFPPQNQLDHHRDQGDHIGRIAEGDRSEKEEEVWLCSCRKTMKKVAVGLEKEEEGQEDDPNEKEDRMNGKEEDQSGGGTEEKEVLSQGRICLEEGRILKNIQKSIQEVLGSDEVQKGLVRNCEEEKEDKEAILVLILLVLAHDRDNTAVVHLKTWTVLMVHHSPFRNVPLVVFSSSQDQNPKKKKKKKHTKMREEVQDHGSEGGKEGKMDGGEDEAEEDVERVWRTRRDR